MKIDYDDWKEETEKEYSQVQKIIKYFGLGIAGFLIVGGINDLISSKDKQIEKYKQEIIWTYKAKADSLKKVFENKLEKEVK